MIKHYEGTVFNTNADIIVNTVNTVGVMGKGLALEFKLRYPNLEKKYLNDFKNNKLLIGLPRIHFVNDQLIMNFPTKKHWKNPSKLSYIEQGLQYISQNYAFLKKEYNINSIAFPKLGTGLGGLEWKDVHNLMIHYLKNIDLTVYICLDELNYAEGLELKMLNILNNLSIDDSSNYLNLSDNKLKLIIENIPFDRFWYLSKVKGISSTSYESIYKQIHNLVKNDIQPVTQISLFNNSIDKNNLELKTKYELINIINEQKKEIESLKIKCDNYKFKRQITNDQIIKVKKYLSKNMSYKEISKIMDISTSSISRIKNGLYDKYLY